MCDRFEAAWRAGPRPRIEDHLAEADEVDRTVLFGELLALERELRQRRGEQPETDEYLNRFPGRAKIVRDTFDRETIKPPAALGGPRADGQRITTTSSSRLSVGRDSRSGVGLRGL